MSVLLRTVLEQLNLWGCLGQCHLETQRNVNSFYLGFCKNLLPTLGDLSSIGSNDIFPYPLNQPSLYLLLACNNKYSRT